jgi:hypothetical protein
VHDDNDRQATGITPDANTFIGYLECFLFWAVVLETYATSTVNDLDAEWHNVCEEPQEQQSVEELAGSIEEGIIDLHQHWVLLNLLCELERDLLHVVTQRWKFQFVQGFLCSVLSYLVEQIGRLEVKDCMLHWDGLLVVVDCALLPLENPCAQVFLPFQSGVCRVVPLIAEAQVVNLV